MPGSSTTPSRQGACDNAPSRVAFHPLNGVGTRDKNTIAAQWLAYALPYRRFAPALRAATHGSGPTRIATPSS